MNRAALLAVALFAPAAAATCPMCTTANPALTTIGADRPYANRVRLAATVRAWEQQLDTSLVRELRMDLTATWSPVSRFTLLLNVPLQARERTLSPPTVVAPASGLQSARPAERGFGPGEIDVSARVLLLGATGLRPRHLLSAVAGVRLPTAPTLHNEAGKALSHYAQLGAGSFVPSTGLLWSSFIGDQWSTFVSLTGEVPLMGRFQMRMGPAVALLHTVQFQPVRWFGLRAGADARYDFAGEHHGMTDTSMAGFQLQPVADVIVAPISQLLIVMGARFPAVDTRPGLVWSSPTVHLSLVVDI